MFFKVSYTTDSTRMSKDKTTYIEVKENHCLFCYSFAKDIDKQLYILVRKHLQLKDYEDLHIWKIYLVSKKEE